MAKDYEINEKDIESVLNYLRLTDPVNATPEIAIAILEDMYAISHTLAHQLDPETLEKVYNDLKKKKNLS